MANSGFVITREGMRRASVTNNGGPLINIVKFRVGYDVNYSLDPVVLRDRTSLSGPVLHEGYTQGYNRIDEDTIEMLCPMGYTVGNFSFGEVGVYLADDTLFAICVFDTRIEKLRSNNQSQTGNRYNLRAYLKLDQAGSIIQPPDSSLDVAKIAEIDSITKLTSPSSSPSNVYLTHSTTETGAPIIAVRDTENAWKFPLYSRYLGEFAATLGSDTTTLIANVGYALVPLSPTAIPEGKYLVQFVSGNLIGVVRSAVLSNLSSIVLSSELPQLPIENIRFQIWQSQSSFVDDQFVRKDSGLYIPELDRPTFMNVSERENYIPISRLDDILKDDDRWSLVPTGAVFYVAGDTVPIGCFEANGGQVSRESYPELYEYLGTTYGPGDGATTFHLPDFRGEFIRGLDQGRGVDPGRIRGSIQLSQIQYHHHVVPLGTAVAPDPASGIAPFGSTANNAKYGLDRDMWGAFWPHTNDGSAYDGAVNADGVMGNETRPRNVALILVIKY